MLLEYDLWPFYSHMFDNTFTLRKKKKKRRHAESLAAPKIGAVLRFWDKWQKCPDLAPIFTIWGGKIGAPLWTDFKWQKCHNLAFIFTIWGGKIGALLWIDFMWLKCPDLAPIFTIWGGEIGVPLWVWGLVLQEKGGFLLFTVKLVICIPILPRFIMI